MATFPFDNAMRLADIVIPMSVGQANEVVRAAESRENGFSSAAIYYDSKGKRLSILVTVSIEDGHMYGYVGEYHPRKDGVAEFVYKP
jgi:hypothetical protein